MSISFNSLSVFSFQVHAILNMAAFARGKMFRMAIPPDVMILTGKQTVAQRVALELDLVLTTRLELL